MSTSSIIANIALKFTNMTCSYQHQLHHTMKESQHFTKCCFTCMSVLHHEMLPSKAWNAFLFWQIQDEKLSLATIFALLLDHGQNVGSPKCSLHYQHLSLIDTKHLSFDWHDLNWPCPFNSRSIVHIMDKMLAYSYTITKTYTSNKIWSQSILKKDTT